MKLSSVINGECFSFADLREVFAKANEEKSGDQLATIAARTERERIAAKSVLAELTLEEIVDHPLIDPELDEVSRLIVESHDRAAFEAVTRLHGRRVSRMDSRRRDQRQHARVGGAGLTPEVVAAVTKLMSNKDLVLGASKIRVVSRCRNTMGQRGVLGIRIQPNHPSDDIAGILLSAVDGLLFGCGDAVIGVNPATDSVAVTSAILRAIQKLIETLAIPTQSCCLSHITTQLACLERGVPIDLLFQSVAGTEAANSSFGISLALLREGQERVLEHHRDRDVAWVGTNAMYFETGQGSALSAGAHHGVDQLTLEARAYGVARAFAPFLVNSVVGFIGPEYLFDERQIIRAGLEDHFMGKLLGLPMGVDVCYTNHAQADQNSADNLLLLLAAAGCNYVMGVPCSDDVMLNYQSTSFHDALAVRRLFGLKPAPEFAAWLEARGLPASQDSLELDRGAAGPRARARRHSDRTIRERCLMPGDNESGPEVRTSATTFDGFMRWDIPRSSPGDWEHSRILRLSFSIICILAGGVTSFHLGLCSVGGAVDRARLAAGGFVCTCGRGHDGAACLGVSDRRRPLPLGVALGWPRVGLGDGLVQPRRARHRTRRDQRRDLSLRDRIIVSRRSAKRLRLASSGPGRGLDHAAHKRRSTISGSA